MKKLPRSDLPEPGEAARMHSDRLAALIRSEIRAQQGWITFSRFMQLVLYAPGMGYYSAGAAKLGGSGDFVTAPEISRLFGRTLARQIGEIVRITGGDILELGAGSGKLASDVLQELEALGALPARYAILEVSADLRERQQESVGQLAPPLAERVVWLDRLPEDFSGVILANEVFDAIPAHVVAWRNGGLNERGVGLAGDNFVWREKPLLDGALFQAARALPAPTDFVSEINLLARSLIESIALTLRHGLLLVIDYGFPAREYYHPQRSQGTLMCHYRQHAHADPFYLPGLQDITAHVDFTALASAARQAGLEVLGYSTQAEFLIQCGILDILSQTPATETALYLPLSNQAQTLLSPAEMGELFKVLALGRGISGPLAGFVSSRGAERLESAS
jgi:SAM-dependent MidA family methyltransferase